MRRFLLTLAVLILAADATVVAGSLGPETRTASAVASRTATTVTALPPTTAPPPPTTAGPRPIDAPTDSYAPEPIRTIGSIEIPKLGINAALGEGISLRNIDRGPSHWPGTAMPGQPGNVVVAGHRITHTHPFRNIDQLVPGDEVIFVIADVRYRYVVSGSQVVTPKQTEIVAQTADATATLFACHPPGSARYRYVVHLRYAP
jgi:sortase A